MVLDNTKKALYYIAEKGEIVPLFRQDCFFNIDSKGRLHIEVTCCPTSEWKTIPLNRSLEILISFARKKVWIMRSMESRKRKRAKVRHFNGIFKHSDGKLLFKVITAAVTLAVILTVSIVPAFADASDSYVALGADLTVDQRAEILSLLDLTENDLADMSVVQITNTMEKNYLGEYLPASVIGSKALSSVRVDKKKSGGINVTTKNISYCTEGMYQNALITAGVENADVIVAGPFSISGTAGLVGAMEAYKGLTGEEISEENADAAVEEIVTTGELADSMGDSEEAENLVALVKQKVIAADGASDEEILQMIDDAAKELGVSLTDTEKQQILALMKKIAQLDLDPEQLKKQASDIYDRLTDLGIDMSDFDKDSFIATISSIFTKLINAIKGLFS